MADTRLGKIGITVKEPWAADISYEALDVTLYAVEDGGDGCSYTALRDNIGVTPGTDPNTWVKSTQAGQSIYDLAVKYHHFVGTEEEFEAEYQAALQAARDAAAGASAVEAQVEAAEALRVAAETGRADAESARQSAEASRASAETARGTAEAARQSAESGRASAETARVTAEQGRASAETERASAEAARAAAETDRVSDFSALKTDMETAIGQADAATAAAVATNNQIQTAEAGRVSAEQGRVSAENARASAESARATAETSRATAETARVTAEGQRATAEGQRVTAENARVSAESGRASAESGRVSAEEGRVSAETARESQASSDHTRAESDHAIVQGYDTRLTNVEGEVSQLGQIVSYLNSDIVALCTIPNKYIKSDGSFGTVGDTRVYWISDYIAIKEGIKIHFKTTNLSVGYSYAIYDSSKNVIGSAVGQGSFDGIISITQSNAAYIVLALNTGGQQELETGISISLVETNDTIEIDGNALPLFSHLNKRLTLIEQTTPKNLFTDFSKFVYAKYIDNTGAEHNLAAAAYYNEFLPIPAGETKLTIVFSYQYAIALYDENKDFLQTIGAQNIYDQEYDLSAYPTAKYVKINLKCDTIPTHPSYDGSHPCYAYFGKKYNENESELEKRTYGTVIKKPIVLAGKNITFFGDSITEGYSSTSSSVIVNGYAKLLCDNFGATIDNKGLSNTRICDPNNSSSSILNRILNYSGVPDVIIIAGGTNDFGHSPQSPIGSFDDATYATLFGALNLICQHLKTNYPNVPVIFITPINRTKPTIATSPTLDFTDLRNAIWRVAVNNGYSVIDGSMLEGFVKFGEESLPIKTQLLADGLHPTDIGHEYMANFLSGLLG